MTSLLSKQHQKSISTKAGTSLVGHTPGMLRSASLARTATLALARVRFCSSQATAQAESLGAQFQQLQFRGRGPNALRLSSLVQMLQQCSGPEHAKFPFLLVDLYQRKGQDFSEEAASHFIQACVRVDAIPQGVEELTHYRHRIGAWTSANSLNYLLSKLEDPQLGLKLVTELPKRGVYFNARTMEHLRRLADAAEDETVKQALQEIVSRESTHSAEQSA